MAQEYDRFEAFLSGHKEENFESMYKIFSKLNNIYLMHPGSRWIPAADVFETDEDFVVLLEIAHIEPKDIKMSMNEDYLIIQGIRNEITKFKKRNYHKMEIDYGPFERRILVPVAVDENSIKTHYQDGFLEIRLKKIDDRRRGEKIISIEWEE